MFFFKKKSEQKDNIDDQDMPVLDKVPDTAPISGSYNPRNADIDMLKAKVVAQEEYRKTLVERINRQSEEIGELRGLLINAQHDLEKLKAETEVAINKVEEVKPEGLFLEIRRVDAKIETMRAKINLVDDVSTKIREEMRDIRESVKGFRGIDEVMRLGNEVKADIVTFKKVEANTGKDASKVENIFVSLQKTLNDIQRAKSLIDNIDESQRKLDKQVSDVTQKMTSFASKNEIVDLRATVNKNITYLDKEMNKIRDLDKRADDALSKLEQRQLQIDSLQEKLMSKISQSDLKKLEETGEQIADLRDKVKNVVDKETFTDLRYMVMKDLASATHKLETESKSLNNAVRSAQNFKSSGARLERLSMRLMKENVKFKEKLIQFEKELKKSKSKK